ncbi:hypothetical protein AT05_08120 [Schleiferia thermophila str. Yellowstone]|jgi:hypothetical protein|uniref:Uncharacterized protein n=1 Tax=Schleiferia thermophila TaxID=884107 RepID=A0A369ABD6_9FLAO|nr:hypothetical protein AT05_08120 [Schleiferia thermophila str. Yellowstone]RCX04734.1 hypothetical protein DES35_1014 [Schleiferia thermophila]
MYKIGLKNFPANFSFLSEIVGPADWTHNVGQGNLIVFMDQRGFHR